MDVERMGLISGLELEGVRELGEGLFVGGWCNAKNAKNFNTQGLSVANSLSFIQYYVLLVYL